MAEQGCLLSLLERRINNLRCIAEKSRHVRQIAMLSAVTGQSTVIDGDWQGMPVGTILGTIPNTRRGYGVGCPVEADATGYFSECKVEFVTKSENWLTAYMPNFMSSAQSHST